MKRVLTSGNLRARTQLTVTVNDVIGTLHITTTDEEIYAVITSSAYPRRSAFEMLGNLRDRAHQALGQESLGGVQKEDEKQGQFKGIMKDLASRYDEPYGDRAKEVGAKVDEVKAVMEGNIGRMLENAENLQNVQDKTESLRAGAQQFQKRSNQIRRQLWWRNFKVRTPSPLCGQSRDARGSLSALCCLL